MNIIEQSRRINIQCINQSEEYYREHQVTTEGFCSSCGVGSRIFNDDIKETTLELDVFDDVVAVYNCACSFCDGKIYIPVSGPITEELIQELMEARDLNKKECETVARGEINE